MGRRLGRECEEPKDLFIPRISLYSRWNSLKGAGKPRTIAKCFIAAMCSLMFWWELYEARFVAKRIRVCSVTGKVWYPVSLQNHSYVVSAEL